ncbi:hypothetical protein GYM76_04210 [Gilliamella sp. ESL0443]|nr:hypothetical protein GYM76_04210 [Gilliamella sp. ESL0443]
MFCGHTFTAMQLISKNNCTK